MGQIATTLAYKKRLMDDRNSTAEIVDGMFNDGKTLIEVVDLLMERERQGLLTLNEIMEELTHRFDRGEFPEEEGMIRSDESMMYDRTL